MPILVRLNETGQAVEDVQIMLNFVMPVLPRLAEDGIFGPMTLARVVQFQKQKAVMADGIVGPITGKQLVTSTFNKLR